MDYSVDDLRRAYAGVSMRAARASRLLDELATQRVWVDAEKALSDISRSIYYSGRYDAGERYDTLEEFEEALLENELAQVPKVAVNDKACYELTPVLHDLGVFRHYHSGRLGSLHLPFTDKFIPSLRAAAQDFDCGALVMAEKASSVAELSSLELSFICSGYRKLALQRVHALRQLRTALTYPRGDRVRTELSAELARMDSKLFELLDSLHDLTHFRSYPEAASFFSSSSDSINLVRTLPADKESFFSELQA